MKKFILSLIGMFFAGCAGSAVNPYFAPDIYGQRKHVYEDGVSLIEIKDTHIDNVYNFRFYENVIASSPQVEMAKKITIKNENIESKCGWSPFNDVEFKGTPVATIISGKIKMKDGKILGEPEGAPLKFS